MGVVSQSIWIGVVIGVFFVGIGISYAIFSNTYNPSTMKFHNQEIFDQMMSQNPKMMANWMETTMQDAQFHDQMMDNMAKNPEQMNQWMVHDPKHVEEMATAMKENHDFMMEMMSVMMNDPDLRLQMLGHMTENPESMEQMKKMMGQSMMDSFTSDVLVKEENGFGLCTSDWYITGYFLPIEADFSGKLVEISVDEVKQFYLADFLEVVTTEGWGKTNAGDYLGWYHDSYHIEDTYLDALGNDLVVGMIAVDTSLIEHGSELIIPTLPAPWDEMVFSATDVGPSIIGKHIDVFTGEGITAENETFRITGSDNTVCMQN